MLSKSVCGTKLEQYLKIQNVEKLLVWDLKGRSLLKNTRFLEDSLDPTSICSIFCITMQKIEYKNLYNGKASIVTHNPAEKHEANKRQTKYHPAFILSSSGSTDLSKGVVITHLNIMTTLATRSVHTL